MDNLEISFFSRLINIIAPNRCAVCGCRLTVGETFVCGRCNLRLPRTNYELHPYDNPMATMFWGRFHIEKCAAMFFYHPHSGAAKIILDLKYNHHPDYGYELGRLMARELMPSQFFDGVTAVMPVPLARNRERHRGYNQSRELAKGICAVTGLRMIDKAVKRSKFVDTQTHKTRSERNDNVAGVFSLADADALSGQHVLLVDDVATTGATLTACAREVAKAGNVKISVLTAALAEH